MLRLLVVTIALLTAACASRVVIENEPTAIEIGIGKKRDADRPPRSFRVRRYDK